MPFLTTNLHSGNELAFFSYFSISGLTVHEICRVRSPTNPRGDQQDEERAGSIGGLAVESFAEHPAGQPDPTLDGMFSFFDFDSGANRRPYGRRDFIVRLTKLAKALAG